MCLYIILIFYIRFESIEFLTINETQNKQHLYTGTQYANAYI